MKSTRRKAAARAELYHTFVNTGKNCTVAMHYMNVSSLGSVQEVDLWIEYLQMPRILVVSFTNGNQWNLIDLLILINLVLSNRRITNIHTVVFL